MSNLESPSLAPATAEPNCVTATYTAANSSDFYGFVSSPLNLECAMGGTPIA